MLSTKARSVSTNVGGNIGGFGAVVLAETPDQWVLEEVLCCPRVYEHPFDCLFQGTGAQAGEMTDDQFVDRAAKQAEQEKNKK